MAQMQGQRSDFLSPALKQDAVLLGGLGQCAQQPDHLPSEQGKEPRAIFARNNLRSHKINTRMLQIRRLESREVK